MHCVWCRDPVLSIGVYIKLNQVQTRTNLGNKPQWKKWQQIQNLLGILLKVFVKAKLKDLCLQCQLQTYGKIPNDTHFPSCGKTSNKETKKFLRTYIWYSCILIVNGTIVISYCKVWYKLQNKCIKLLKKGTTSEDFTENVGNPLVTIQTVLGCSGHWHLWIKISNAAPV